MKLLFWNVCGLKGARVKSALEAANHDIIVLAESPAHARPPALTRQNLVPSSIGVSCRETLKIAPTYEEGRIFIGTVVGLTPWTLVACHLPSKLHRTPEDQLTKAMRLRDAIERVESSHGHSRTLVVGDFNMNPFDVGLVHSEGMHAVMTAQIASRQKRRVDGLERRFFYNPMWSCLGDRPNGPAGTYYRSAGASMEQFWHIYDQVLVRPAMASLLQEVEILDQIGDCCLLDQTGHPSVEYSDHLPISVSLSL